VGFFADDGHVAVILDRHAVKNMGDIAHFLFRRSPDLLGNAFLI